MCCSYLTNVLVSFSQEYVKKSYILVVWTCQLDLIKQIRVTWTHLNVQTIIKTTPKTSGCLILRSPYILKYLFLLCVCGHSHCGNDWTGCEISRLQETLWCCAAPADAALWHKYTTNSQRAALTATALKKHIYIQLHCHLNMLCFHFCEVNHDHPLIKILK